MKPKSFSRLLDKLRAIHTAVEPYADEEKRRVVVAELDQLIQILTAIRRDLTQVADQPICDELQDALARTITLLAEAESNRTVQMAVIESLAPARNKARGQGRAAQRQIPGDLTNDQIRSLLKENLSRRELQEIARQRSIPSGDRPKAELEAAILRFLERGEGYNRLRGQ
jgi:hypothetical protein